MIVLLGEVASHGGEHATIITHLFEQAHEAYKEMVGGFAGGLVGYVIHTTHHRIFHWLSPRRVLRMKGGH